MGGEFSVMLLSGPDPAGPPPTMTFAVPEGWTQVEIRLADFPTATPEIIGGAGVCGRGAGWGIRV